MSSQPRLPPRDSRYFFGLAGVGVITVVLLVIPPINIEYIAIASTLVIAPLLNIYVFRLPIFAYDRILSAVSSDGSTWTKEPGVRIDVGGLHKSVQVYYPEVTPTDAGFRLYYTAGGYNRIIASAFSTDGLHWCEEAGVRIGPTEGHEFGRIECAAVVRVGPEVWWIYFAAFSDDHWRIYRSTSSDGLDWTGPVLSIDRSATDCLSNVKDPCVVKVDGGHRLFYTSFSRGKTVLYTAVSSDGLHWLDQRSCSGYQQEYCKVHYPTLSKTATGDFRMYFVEWPEGTPIGTNIVSARSSDGVNWTRDPGVRISPGGDLDRHGVGCPKIVETDSGWRMYYAGFWGRHLLEALTLREYHRGLAPGAAYR